APARRAGFLLGTYGGSTMASRTRMGAAVAFICALALTTFSLPGNASPDKLYGLEFLLLPTTTTANPNHANPLYDANGQLVPPTEVTAKFKNESPPSVGASNISSLQFAVDNLVIDSVACPRGNCTFDPATNTVSVTNISPPVQATEIFPVTVRVRSCV